MLTVPHFPFISSGSLLSVLNTSKFAYFPNLSSAGNSGVYLVGCASAAHVSSPGAFIKIFQMKTFSAPSREHAGSFPHSTVLILITGLQAVCTLYPIKKPQFHLRLSQFGDYSVLCGVLPGIYSYIHFVHRQTRCVSPYFTPHLVPQ